MKNSVEDFKNEFEAFIGAGETASSAISPKLGDVANVIKKDLVRSRSQLFWYYVGVSVIGYFVSLIVCAQNALGIFSFSQDLAMAMCALSQPWCWIACGSIFTGTPFFISLFFLNRFQQRYLLFKMWWLFISLPLLASTIMVVLPFYLRDAGILESTGHAMMYLETSEAVMYWLLAAILTPYFLEFCLYLFLRQRRAESENSFS